MNENKRMILGYIVGGLLVIVLVPSIIYIITSLFDNMRIPVNSATDSGRCRPVKCEAELAMTL